MIQTAANCTKRHDLDFFRRTKLDRSELDRRKKTEKKVFRWPPLRRSTTHLKEKKMASSSSQTLKAIVMTAGELTKMAFKGIVKAVTLRVRKVVGLMADNSREYVKLKKMQDDIEIKDGWYNHRLAQINFTKKHQASVVAHAFAVLQRERERLVESMTEQPGVTRLSVWKEQHYPSGFKIDDLYASIINGEHL